MTDTHDYHQQPTNVFVDNMKLASSASEQNVYFTYVGLVNGVKPGGNLSPNFGSNTKAPFNITDVPSTINNEVSLFPTLKNVTM